jgi:6 kDa early secretory antigenic target
MTSGGVQVWNFVAIDAAVGSITGIGGAIDGECDAIKGQLAALASQWGGGSSEAWQAQQIGWDNDAQNLNMALRNLTAKIGEANAGMQATEGTVGGRFV